MATVSDYLDWSGDISFSDDPFNEVDNVLLSLIAYVDFEGVLDEEKGMSIGEVCRRKQFSEVLRVLARDGTSVLAQELKKNLDGKRKD
jgi:hypothetical protein